MVIPWLPSLGNCCSSGNGGDGAKGGGILPELMMEAFLPFLVPRFVRIGNINMSVSLRGYFKLKINGATLDLKEWVGRSLFCSWHDLMQK